MAITGPSWSKEALYVDLCLPRQAATEWFRSDLFAEAEPQPEGLWAVLKIEKFPREFVLDSHSQVGDDDLLELGSPAPKAHYILQYRCYDPDVPFSSASACPLVEEKYWREVPIIKPLDGGEDRVFLAAGLDSGALTKTKEHCWAKFRLASRVWSHFSFASLAAPVSPLQPPARPELSVEWVDSPSLDGLRIRVSAPCDMLSQAYQLRFRLSKDSSKSAWQLCDLVPMKLEALGQEGLSVEALAPTDQLHYHSEYHFSIRTCSLFRFSPWSEDSTAFRISLEHEGMCQDECGVEVEIYGQEERHNCRCPVADVSWAPLALPKAVDLTIEYRLRWRRRLPAYNDAVALYAAMDELRSIHDQGDEWQGRREEASGGVRPVRLMVPDPDEQLQDIANRGYLGDCTKRFHGLPEFSPWQLAAVVRAKVGPQSVKRCSYALTFLQSGADYEVQVDWRWQRLGDSFWMPAYPAKRFHMPSAPQQPPLLRPLRILPEVLDGHEQLQSLCNLCQQEGQRLGRGFGLFEWPFEQPPALAQMLALAPTGSQLTEEWRRDPGLYGTFTVQCRRQSWVLCQVALLEISGKAACFVFAPPEQPLEDQRTADATDEPKPTPLPEMPQLEDGDMEFRVLRTNDCEVSEVLTYPALPLEPPVDVQCRLKMTGPQSAFGVAICFRGLPSPGFASAPEEYQIRMQEMQGSEVVKEEVLPPRRLPMNRVAEAFPDALQRPDFLGQARSLECAVRSGGQPERRLEELEFEHFLTDVIYGKTYHIAVRWMSKFKVSPWSAVAKSDVSFPPPTTAEEVLSVKLLPDATMSAELAGKDFSPPALWHRFQLTWQPFMASLWGSRMEYRLERRSLLHDRRTSPEGILPELDSAELETSPWELIGQVMADIDDASGKGTMKGWWLWAVDIWERGVARWSAAGRTTAKWPALCRETRLRPITRCYQLQSRRKGHTKEELLQSFHAKDGRPRDEQLDGLFGRRSLLDAYRTEHTTMLCHVLGFNQFKVGGAAQE
ncbi:Hypothetical protein (Fragment) [Durusdinium trenchii]|uniref:Uncharacterized protein n=1 Tax=Durusdinium trenchii TaxID=1381693 RepID=A0ABP0HXG4_9DINO